MANPFVEIGDNFYAENYNGAILFFSMLKPQMIITLPDDYEGAAFLSGDNKVAFMNVNLILNDCEIYDNKIRLVTGKTTGTATFRIYPNLAPFKSWDSISWTKTATTGTINCSIYRNSGGSLIHSDISNPEILSDEGMTLEYIDFTFTLTEVSGNRPTLNTVALTITGGL